MLDRILVGTDFSAPSAAMLSCVPQLRQAGVREVVLGHVVYVANTPGLEEMLEQEALPSLEEAAQKLCDAGLQVTTDIRVGVPAVVLAEMAEAHDVSAIVVGSHGRSMLGRILLGSVSSEVLHQTTRPVLIIPIRICDGPMGTTCEAACANLFDKVLFPTDFSAGSEHAFHVLTRIVAQTHSACRLLHVQDEARMRYMMERLPEFNTKDAARLDEMTAALVEAGARTVETQTTLGSPTRVIVQEAARNGVSLILMSTHGRGALAEVMVGSVAMNVARLAPVPVLFVPSP